MKKIMIALAAVAMAAGVQAATINWGTGQLFAPSDATGAKGSGATYAIRNADGSTLSWYVFASLSATDYTAAQTAGAVYGWLTTAPKSGTKLAPSAQGTGNTAAATTITASTYSANDTVNWAAVIVYTDSSSKTWYTEAYGSDKFDSLGSTISKSNIGKNVSTWTAAGGSPEPTPEPTSGLLLVLGMASLALRRRRA